MADNPVKETVENSGANLTADRRTFVKSAAAASLLGAASATRSFSRESSIAAGESFDDDPPKAPAGLAPKALLDQRFPIKYVKSVPEAVRVLTQYFAALTERNLQGMAEMCHFPFASFEGMKLVVVKSEEEFLKSPPPSMNLSLNPDRWTDHDGFLKPGCYDTFGGIEIFNSNPICANLSLVYNRYNNTGNLLHQCQGVYCITNNDGKWGIQLMSTMFTPGDIVGKVYNDAIEAALRTRVIHDIGPTTNDSDADLYDYQYGPNANVAAGDGGFIGVSNSADAMAAYKTKGIKSRLRLGELKPEDPSPDAALNMQRSGGGMDHKDDWKWYRDMYESTGLGKWGFAFGILPYSRVIHATVDKVHMFSGITRYTASGEVYNSSAEVAIVTWKKGRWGRAGSCAGMIMQDRVNDLRNIRA